MFVNEPAHYLEMLGELPDGVTIIEQSRKGPVDFIHFFAENEAQLHILFPSCKEKMDINGMIWASWIKGSSKMDTDINGNDVRRLGLEIGLVDIKVCAVDEDWSGLKFMYRKEDR